MPSARPKLTNRDAARGFLFQYPTEAAAEVKEFLAR
jgi:hypothetical protein